MTVAGVLRAPRALYEERGVPFPALDTRESLRLVKAGHCCALAAINDSAEMSGVADFAAVREAEFALRGAAKARGHETIVSMGATTREEVLAAYDQAIAAAEAGA